MSACESNQGCVGVYRENPFSISPIFFFHKVLHGKESENQANADFLTEKCFVVYVVVVVVVVVVVNDVLVDVVVVVNGVLVHVEVVAVVNADVVVLNGVLVDFVVVVGVDVVVEVVVVAVVAVNHVQVLCEVDIGSNLETELDRLIL